MDRLFFGIGAVLAGLGVALGAFGAHGLADRVTPERLETFRTGVLYHLIHALGLLAVGWVAAQGETWLVRAAGYSFIAGILIFSGSLYLLVLTDTRWLGAVTPLGGVAFLLGWGFLAWAMFSADG